MEREKHKEINKITKELKSMDKRALKADKQRDDALDKITEQRKEICRLSIEWKKKNIKQPRKDRKETGSPNGT